MGYDASSKDPAGGVIQRNPASSLAQSELN
jgi:hypothetical protein